LKFKENYSTLTKILEIVWSFTPGFGHLSLSS